MGAVVVRPFREAKGRLEQQVARGDLRNSCAISQRRRKRIEQSFGGAKFVGPNCQIMMRGLKKVDQRFALTMAA